MAQNTAEPRTRIVPPEERFGVLMVDLLDEIKVELKRIAPRTSFTQLKIAKKVVRTVDDRLLVLEFVKHCYDQWETLRLIIDNDEQAEKILSDGVRLGGKRTNAIIAPYFKLLVGHPEAQRKNLWELIHSLVKCTIHYLYENPTIRPIKIESLEILSARWNIKLGMVVRIPVSSDEEERSGEDESEDESED